MRQMRQLIFKVRWCRESEIRRKNRNPGHRHSEDRRFLANSRNLLLIQSVTKNKQILRGACPESRKNGFLRLAPLGIGMTQRKGWCGQPARNTKAMLPTLR